jgi:hypothetical protein
MGRKELSMARHDILKMLKEKDKGVGKTFGMNGTLSRLFRQMLLDLEIGPERFGSLMTDYLRDPKHRISKNRKDITSARGNLGMALAQPSMTFKVFCKGLKFLKIVKIEIGIRAYYSSGRESFHHTSMTLTEYIPPKKVDAMDAADAQEAGDQEEHREQ